MFHERDRTDKTFTCRVEHVFTRSVSLASVLIVPLWLTALFRFARSPAKHDCSGMIPPN
jgi:hypothetical protein